jgi:DNA-binding CsgD family transcriptional regulator
MPSTLHPPTKPAPHADDLRAEPFRQLRQLEGENRRLRADARHAASVEHALRERVKELNCLYGIARLVDEHGDRLDALLPAIAELLPVSWQYPDACCARIVLGGQAYESAGFVAGPWSQTAEVRVFGQPAGTVEVVYTEPMPEADEGPFLREERALIDAVAERIGSFVERIETDRRLRDALTRIETERAALGRANTALREILDQIEQQKASVRQSIASSVQRVVLPVIQSLESELPPRQRHYADVIRHAVREIALPSNDALAEKLGSLSPTEIHVCNMIRSGMSTKEIARLRHVSQATVSRQRERIRHKLGLTGTGGNLQTYLQRMA